MPAIESLKRVYGSAMVSMTPEGLIEVQRGNRYLKPIPRHNLASIIEARMTDIADYVWNEIREANFAKKLSAGIVLTGGVANLKNVAELFQSVTGIETRVACAELGITTESLEMVASPNLTLAVSLLLRGAQKGATPVSILQRPIQEPVQPEKPTVVTEPVKEPKQEVKPEEKVVTPPTSLNEKLAQQEQEKTTPVEEEEEKEIDINGTWVLNETLTPDFIEEGTKNVRIRFTTPAYPDVTFSDILRQDREGEGSELWYMAAKSQEVYKYGVGWLNNDARTITITDSRNATDAFKAALIANGTKQE
jgi:cell division ATPase FtsA